MAIRNAPFLNGPTPATSRRVPSGAIRIDSPLRAASSTGSRAATAAAVSARSMNAASSSLPSVPASGLPAEFLLGHAGPVVLDQRGDHEHVEVVAVVEQEDGRPLRGQVLLADHVQPHAVQREHGLGPVPGQEVDPGAPAMAQHADAQRAGRHRPQRAERGQVPGPAERPAAAAAVQPQDRPAAAFGHPGQPRPGVDRPRVAHQVHEGEVLVAVGVEVARPQVDVVVGGELLHAGGLGVAPDDRLLDGAGQDSVLVDHEPVAHHVVDAEVAGHRLGLHAQRGRAQHHGVAAALVGADQVAHLRVDPVRHGLLEDPLAHLLDVLGQPPAGRAGPAFDQGLDLPPPELVLHRELRHAQEVARADLPPEQPVHGVRRGGEPGHQRPVQIEERAGPRAFRAGVDLGHRPRQAQLRPGRRRVGGHARFRPRSITSSNPSWRDFSS